MIVKTGWINQGSEVLSSVGAKHKAMYLLLYAIYLLRPLEYISEDLKENFRVYILCSIIISFLPVSQKVDNDLAKMISRFLWVHCHLECLPNSVDFGKVSVHYWIGVERMKFLLLEAWNNFYCNNFVLNWSEYVWIENTHCLGKMGMNTSFSSDSLILSKMVVNRFRMYFDVGFSDG